MVKDVGFRSKQDSLELDSFIAPEISQLNEAIKEKGNLLPKQDSIL